MKQAELFQFDRKQACLALGLVGLLNSPNALARCELQLRHDTDELNVQLTQPMHEDFSRRVQTGVTVRLVHQVHLSDEAENHGVLRFGCDIVYDPWAEAYDVKALAMLPGEASAKPGTLAPKQPSQLTLHLAGAKLAAVPALCLHLDLWPTLRPGAAVDILTQLDPVSDDEVKATRRWLAERSIGMAAPTLIGRAVAALIDLKGGLAAESHCALPPAAARR